MVAGLGTVGLSYGQSGLRAAVGALLIGIFALGTLLCLLCGCLSGAVSATCWGPDILSHPPLRKVANILLLVPACITVRRGDSEDSQEGRPRYGAGWQ